MTLVRADLGARHTATRPRCKSDAWTRELVILTDQGVTVEPWQLPGCPSCGLLAKHRS